MILEVGWPWEPWRQYCWIHYSKKDSKYYQNKRGGNIKVKKHLGKLFRKWCILHPKGSLLFYTQNITVPFDNDLSEPVLWLKAAAFDYNQWIANLCSAPKQLDSIYYSFLKQKFYLDPSSEFLLKLLVSWLLIILFWSWLSEAPWWPSFVMLKFWNNAFSCCPDQRIHLPGRMSYMVRFRLLKVTWCSFDSFKTPAILARYKMSHVYKRLMRISLWIVCLDGTLSHQISRNNKKYIICVGRISSVIPPSEFDLFIL